MLTFNKIKLTSNFHPVEIGDGKTARNTQKRLQKLYEAAARLESGVSRLCAKILSIKISHTICFGKALSVPR